MTVQLEALRALIAKWQAEEAQEPEGADDERSEVDLQSILHMLTARLDGSQVCVRHVGSRVLRRGRD